MQHYIHYANEIENIFYQSKVWFENSQKTGKRN